jgi:drug/metabolite transporter (DMT)-like permease
VLTAVTLVAFAANSVLARTALGSGAADPAGFTAVRLISGAATLWLITRRRAYAPDQHSRGSWLSGWWLFLYAISFSFAYVSLSTGTGALILFAMVQATMIVRGLRHGERPHALQWLGLVLAMGGLVLLVAPGLTAPSPFGCLLMATAGVSWGLYSLRGRGVSNPVRATAGNFARTVPMAVAAAALLLPSLEISSRGLLLAVASGSLASGIGYVFWYAAMRGLTTTRASIVQLAVPALAALGGVVFLAEELTLRLAVSGAAILGGVGIAVSASETRAE